MATREEGAPHRRGSENLEEFLLELSDALRPLIDPTAIQAVAARVLGEHLGVSRALYSDVERNGDGPSYVVRQDYHAPGQSSLVGRFRASDFGVTLFERLCAGRVVVVADVAVEPLLDERERAAYRAVGIRAFVGVPLVKRGLPVAFMSVQHSVPRAWTPHERALVEETAERTWAAVERARAEAALRASEEKYHTLFDSIDEGFCVLEVLEDDAGRAVDCEILEVNPAQERMSGVRLFPGQRVRGVFPTIEGHWLDTYARIVATGEPERFEHYNQVTDRWFSA